jgi:hypothetical protein
MSRETINKMVLKEMGGARVIVSNPDFDDL